MEASSRPSSPVQEGSTSNSSQPSASHFLSKLSSQKLAASTTTGKGAVVGLSPSSIDFEDPSGGLQVERRSGGKGSSLEDAEPSRNGSPSNHAGFDAGKLRHSLIMGMRTGSAMRTSFPTMQNVSPAPATSFSALSAELTSEVIDDSQRRADKLDPPTKFSDAKDNHTPAAEGHTSSVSTWLTWTSRAAIGSLSLLKQGGSAAIGLGTTLKTNPFRRLSHFDSNPELEASKQSQHDDQIHAENDDAHLVRSAADLLRIGAKNEGRRRRAQQLQRISDKSSQASRDRQKNIEGGKVPQPYEVEATRAAKAAASSDSHLSSIKGLNIFDFTASLPQSDSLPISIPERQYFILTQAGKPVFLSHLAKKRLLREEAARDRVRAASEQRRALEARLLADDLSSETRLTIEDDLRQCERQEQVSRGRDAEESDRDEEESAVQAGVIQALVSNFSDCGPKTLERKSIENLKLPRRCTRVVYLLREPLYLAVISTWSQGGYLFSDPTTSLKAQLEVLHAGVVSLISEHQLHQMFSRGHNFDLRRMLEGTDGILESLVAKMQTDFGLSLGAGGGGWCLRPFRMDLKLREDLTSCLNLERCKNVSIAKALAAPPERNLSFSSSRGGLDPRSILKELPPRPKDLLYVLLVSAEGQLITLLRSRKRYAYPLDLHLLINTISSMSRRSAREAGTVNWVPICLPRFAPQGMVQAHISWLGKGGTCGQAGASGEARATKNAADCALIIVTADRESFEEVSMYRDAIVGLLSLPPRPPLIALTLSGLSCRISPDALRQPGLRHFVLKKRDDLQVVWSEWVDDYAGPEEDAAFARLRVTRTYERARELCVLAAKSQKKGNRGPKNTLREQTASALFASQSRSTAGSGDGADALGQGTDADAEGVAMEGGDDGDCNMNADGEDLLPPVPPAPLDPSQSFNFPCYAHYFRTSHEVIYVECPPDSVFASLSSVSTLSSVQIPALSQRSREDRRGKAGTVAGTVRPLLTVPSYEIYLALSPHVPPHAAVRIARGVLQWGFDSGDRARAPAQQNLYGRRGGAVDGLGGEVEADGPVDDPVSATLDRSSSSSCPMGGERWRLWLGRGTVF